MQPLDFTRRLMFAWIIPILAYWCMLYALTRQADPMAFPIISSAALLVPTLNAGVLLIQFRSKGFALLVGLLLPACALWFIAF